MARLARTLSGAVVAAVVAAGLSLPAVAAGAAAAAADPATFDSHRVLDLAFDGSLQDGSPRAIAVSMQKGSAAYGTGLSGQAFSFTGTNAVNLGTATHLQPANLSVSFWYKPTATMTGEQVFAWSKTVYNSDGWYLTSESDSAALALSVGPSSGQPYKVSVTGTRAQFFPVNTWTHVVVTYDAATKAVTFYRNGVRHGSVVNYAATGSATGVLGSSATMVKTLGYNGPNYNGAHLRGLVDDYRLYDAVAGTRDVVALTQAHDPAFDPAAVAQADLDALAVPATAVSTLTLPLAGRSGSEVAWESSDPALIAVQGSAAVVTRPEDADAQVTLTARASYGGSAERSKAFVVTVPKAADLEASPFLADAGLANVTVSDAYLLNGRSKTVQYLLDLDPERFLYSWYQQAGLTPTTTSGYGGWERSSGTRFQGHFFGHYLSSLAQAYAAEEDASTKQQLLTKLTTAVTGLKRVQDAYALKDPTNAGYVAPFSTGVLPGGGDGLLVPFYNLHKVEAGLLDAYQYAPAGVGATALQVASGFGTWVKGWASRQANPSAILNTEYGGMNEALYELYAITENPDHKRAAEYFDEVSLFQRLANGQDVLNGLHANTTIPKLVGALKRYTLFTENPRLYAQLTQAEKDALPMYLAAAQNFWQIVVDDHTYANGANSQSEHFHGADTLYQYATNGVATGYGENSTAEGCNEYNMLKLSRALFQVTQDKKYADYYESTYINTILASQHPETGMVTYFQPQTAGYAKVFGTRFDQFWCDHGTGIESFTKLGDSIYFRDEDSVFVNQFRSSELRSKAHDLRLTQTADVPASDTVTFSVAALTAGGSVKAGTELRLRVPDWVASTPTLTVNGQPQDVAALTEDGYVVVPVAAGDELTYRLPAEVTVSDTTENPNWVAFKYGPVLLATELSRRNVDATYTAGVLVAMSVKDPSLSANVVVEDAESWKQDVAANLERLADGPNANGTETMRFRLRGVDPASAGWTFEPYYSLYGARYATYVTLVEPDSPAAQDLILKRKQQQRIAETTLDSLTSFDNNNSEADKNYKYNKSGVGVWQGEGYRDGQMAADAFFQYEMIVDPTLPENFLGVRYFGGDNGRTFDVYVNDVLLKHERITNARGSNSWYVQYDRIPQAVLDGIPAANSWKRDQSGSFVLDADGQRIPVVTVRFQGNGSSYLGGVYGVYTASSSSYDSDPHLSGLSATPGVVSPALADGVTDYTVHVPVQAESVTLDLDPAVPSGLVYVDGVLVDDTLGRTVPLTGATTSVTVKAVAQDHTTSLTYTVRVVRVAPTVTAEVLGAAPGVDGWRAGAAQVALSMADGDGAVLQYRVDGGPWSAYTGPVEAPEGTSTVEHRAVVGTEPVDGTAGSVEVRTDTVAPTTSATVSPESGTVLSGETVTATFTASDATSGVARTEWSTDGGSTWTTGSDVSFTSEGTHVVRYRSVDVAGNVEEAGTVTLTVADPGGVATATVKSTDEPSVDGWYAASVRLTLKAPATGQTVQYRLDGGTWQGYTSVVVLGASGVHLVDHRLVSAGGSVVAGSEAQVQVKVDKVVPTRAAVRTPATTGTPRNPVTLDLSATDLHSGVDRIEYQDGGAWLPVTGPLVLDTVGTHTVSYRSVDRAGNVSPARTVSTTITADPTPAVSVNPASPHRGAVVTVRLTGFQRYDDVALVLGGVSLGSVLTDVKGAARVSLPLPSDVPAGPAVLSATSSDGAVTATRALTVRS